MERERGENPRRYLSVYVSKFLCFLSKDSHWETEKASKKCRAEYPIRHESQDLL